MSRTTVAIIGGGFSGTVAAIRLLTSSQNGGPSLPFGSRVVLIEPARAGEGLAYRAGPDYWRLNVPAEQMSAFPERPNDFLQWAQGRNPMVSGSDFLPRSWYGDYLSERLDLARRRSPRWLGFERLRTRATGIDVANGSARIEPRTAGRRSGSRDGRDRQFSGCGPGARCPACGAATPGTCSGSRSCRPTCRACCSSARASRWWTWRSRSRTGVRTRACSRSRARPPAAALRGPRATPPRQVRCAGLLGRGPLSRRLHEFRARGACLGRRLACRIPGSCARSCLRCGARRGACARSCGTCAPTGHASSPVPGATRERIDLLRNKKRLEIEAGRLVETRRIKGGVLVTWRPRGARCSAKSSSMRSST